MISFRRAGISFLLMASAAIAALPSAQELQSREWWFKQSMDELAKVKDPKMQLMFYKSLGDEAERTADVELAKLVLQKYEELKKNDASLPPFCDLERITERSKIKALAVAGKSEAAMLEARKSNIATASEVIQWLKDAGHYDALRALASDSKLGRNELFNISEFLFNDAMQRMDKTAAAEAVAVIKTGGISLNSRASAYVDTMGSYVQPFGKIDAPRAVMLAQILPDDKERSARAADIIQALARAGYAKEALVLLPLVKERRGPAVSILARTLAEEGRIEDAKKVVESVTEADAIPEANYALACGLAINGKFDEAKQIFAKVPQEKLRDKGAEFSMALVVGEVFLRDNSAGKKFATMDERAVGTLISTTVKRLLVWNRIEDAAVLNTQFPATGIDALRSKGTNCYAIALAIKARKAAKDDALFKATVAELDGLLPQVTDEKEKLSAAKNLATAHCGLDDIDTVIKLLASPEFAKSTPESRDSFRMSLLDILGERGNYKAVPKLMATYEGKLQWMQYGQAYTQVIMGRMSKGNFDGAAEWIATWPDPEARCSGYGAVAMFVEAAMRERTAKTATTSTKPATK